jgi:predicted lipoprotein with Yx(FWY)xxD motif
MKVTISTAIGAATLLLLAACGSSGGTSAQGQSTPTGPMSSGVKLTAQSVPQVGKVLVDASGMTVYAADQQTANDLKCTGSCNSIWVPVTVPASTKPVAEPGVTARLSTVTLTNGDTQVTAGGNPLYAFSFDQSPGSIGGNGVTDSFNGTDFTWHAVTPSGKVLGTAPTPSPSPSDSSNGGYHY